MVGMPQVAVKHPAEARPGADRGASIGPSRPDFDQMRPVSTSRMNAAALSQQSSASSTEPVAPSGPTRTT
jgi:hypothetical protein